MNLWNPGNFGFQNPALLWGLPLLAAFLVWIYLRRGQGRQVLVSSVLLLRGLKSPVTARRRFVPPPRFFFELLVVAILCASLAGLFRRGQLRRYAIIIDNSFSMAAQHQQASERISLLTEALRNSSALVHSLSSDARIEVWISAPQAISLTGGLVEKDAALSALEKIELAFAEGNLQTLIDRSALDESLEKIFIFSDHSAAPSQSGEAEQDRRFILRTLYDSNHDGLRSNTAITDIEWHHEFGSSTQRALALTLQAFSPAHVRGKLVLSAVLTGPLPVSHRPITEKQIELSGAEAQTVLFGDLPLEAEIFKLHFEARPDGPPDLITQDNEAWLAVEDRQEKVLVIGDLPAEKLGLKSLRNLEFESLPPEQYRTLSLRGRGRSAVFHRYLPDKPPPINSLFVMPQSSSAWLNVGPELAAVEITAWQTVHPLLRYLNLEALSLKSSRSFMLPVWAREVVSSNAGPLAIAGEFEGYRYAATAFEIFPFEGKKTPLLSILTLNILKWITSLGTASGYRSANSALELGDDSSELYYMDGTRVGTAASSPRGVKNEAPVNSAYLSRPGVYIGRKEGRISLQTAVNYFSEAESNLLSQQTVKIPRSTGLQQEYTGRKDMAGWLARLLALLLFADLAVMLLRAFRAGRAAA